MKYVTAKCEYDGLRFTVSFWQIENSKELGRQVVCLGCQKSSPLNTMPLYEITGPNADLYRGILTEFHCPACGKVLGNFVKSRLELVLYPNVSRWQ